MTRPTIIIVLALRLAVVLCRARRDTRFPPLEIKTQGERLRLEVVNRTMMMHPLHVHGHTFALADSGVRKDTVVLRPMD